MTGEYNSFTNNKRKMPYVKMLDLVAGGYLEKKRTDVKLLEQITK